MAAFTLSAPVTRPRPHSSFELKVKELDNLKEEIHAHLRKLNILKIRYAAWFKHRHQTFVDTLHLVEIVYHLRITTQTATIENFRRYYEMIYKIPQKGNPVERCVSIFEEYLELWEELLDLHKQGQCFQRRIGDYSKSVTRMRDPRLNDSVEQLQSRLDEEIDERFNFMTILPTADQLFAYSVAPHEQTLQALLSYIPHLLSTASTICSLCTKMLLEEV